MNHPEYKPVKGLALPLIQMMYRQRTKLIYNRTIRQNYIIWLIGALLLAKFAAGV